MANMDFMWCFKTIISNEPRKIWETCEIIVKSHGKSWWKNVKTIQNHIAHVDGP
jgi:hypothetical protein